MKARRLLVVLVCASLCLMLGSAGATPLFGIHTLQEWEDALEDGRIKPVTGEEFRLMVAGDDQWPAEYRSAEFYTPELTVEMHEDSHGKEEAALVMRWGDTANPPPQGTRVAAAWDFVYPQDPDLTGTRIEFSLHTPCPCMYYSLNIIDENGNYREWIWHSDDLPGKLPPCTWSTVWVDPVSGASNYAPEAYFEHPAGGGVFDITKIQWIRFNENGIWSPEFQDWTGLVWNAWDHVEVTPEPGTMLLVGSGLLGLVLRRRRKK